jgi:hypothetical protein
MGPKIHYSIHKSSPPVPILSQNNPVDIYIYQDMLNCNAVNVDLRMYVSVYLFMYECLYICLSVSLYFMHIRNFMCLPVYVHVSKHI